MIKLALINEDHIIAPDIDQFKAWLQPVAMKLQASGELCIKIIGLAESQHLNHTYRQKDKPTNVLSFPADVPDFVESVLLGDLAICAAVVEQEAKEQEKDLSHHWAHLCIHGCLHLLGYDHIDPADAEVMEALEVELLAGLQIPDPYH